MEVVDLPQPKPDRGEALVRVRSSGICHTDLEILRGNYPTRYPVVAGDRLLPIADLPFEEAALAEPLACVLHGLNRLVIPSKAEVLIFGAGPIGVLMQVALQAGEANPQVTVVDLRPSRLEIAKRLGAAQAVLAGDLPQEDFKSRFSVVIDATGVPAVIEPLPRYAQDRGTILLFGVAPPHRRVSYSPYEVYYRELTILGSYSLNGELSQAVALLGAGKIPTKAIVTNRVALEEVPAYLSNPGGSGTLKVQAVFP
jgi:threonine dehydrogenase-like Zn-dependent dehydrogenase